MPLATGHRATALGAFGPALLSTPAYWAAVAGIAGVGLLNVGVSFWLAFAVALRSREVRVADRTRIGAAVRSRLLRRPFSFVWPPRDG